MQHQLDFEKGASGTHSDYAMGWTIWGSTPGTGNRLVSSPKHPDRLWDPHSPLFYRYQGLLSWAQSADHVPLYSAQWSCIFAPCLHCFRMCAGTLLYIHIQHRHVCFRATLCSISWSRIFQDPYESLQLFNHFTSAYNSFSFCYWLPTLSLLCAVITAVMNGQILHDGGCCQMQYHVMLRTEDMINVQTLLSLCNGSTLQTFMLLDFAICQNMTHHPPNIIYVCMCIYI